MYLLRLTARKLDLSWLNRSLSAKIVHFSKPSSFNQPMHTRVHFICKEGPMKVRHYLVGQDGLVLELMR